MTPEQKTLYCRLAVAITGDEFHGRAVKECPTCKGRKKRRLRHGEIVEEGDEVDVGHPWHGPEEWKPATCVGKPAPDPKYPAHRVYRRDCTDCGGHGSVFREWLVCEECEGSCYVPAVGYVGDWPYEEGEECMNCEDGRIPDDEGREIIAEAIWDWREKRHGWRPTENWITPPLDSWDCRHNRPWRDSIEPHVRNYRRDPPDFSTLEGCEALKGMLREAGHPYSIGWTAIGFDAGVLNHFSGQKSLCDSDTEPEALVAASVAAFLEKGGE